MSRAGILRLNSSKTRSSQLSQFMAHLRLLSLLHFCHGRPRPKHSMAKLALNSMCLLPCSSHTLWVGCRCPRRTFRKWILYSGLASAIEPCESITNSCWNWEQTFQVRTGPGRAARGSWKHHHGQHGPSAEGPLFMTWGPAFPSHSRSVWLVANVLFRELHGALLSNWK